MAAIRVPWGWRPDPESPMPPAMQTRHKGLCEAASACYKRRDRAQRQGLIMEAHDFLALGDIYYAQARALSAEWHA